jgi:hypothetical protein
MGMRFVKGAGNSVFEGMRDAAIKKIHVVSGKKGGMPAVRWAHYNHVILRFSAFPIPDFGCEWFHGTFESCPFQPALFPFPSGWFPFQPERRRCLAKWPGFQPEKSFFRCAAPFFREELPRFRRELPPF